MKVISDDIHRLKRLDNKYEKLTDPADADTKECIAAKILKVRANIVGELDRQKGKIDRHKANYLDDNEGQHDSDKVARWDKWMKHIDEKIKEIDSIIDPNLISKDESQNS